MAATALASALLASAGVEAPLVDGARTAGQQDGFNWELSIDRYREPERDQRATFLATKRAPLMLPCQRML